MERQVKQDIMKKFEDQVIITKKTELAFETQEKLVRAKNELIENYKTLIAQQKIEACRCKEVDMISNCDSNSISDVDVNGEHDTSGLDQLRELTILAPGLHEIILCLNNIAKHGVVMNGFLLWADIQRRTTALNIWKEEALKRFTKEEITDAKEMLWDLAGDKILGKIIRRQGASKSKSEIDDICTALINLSENEVLPLFISTSNMVLSTPLFNGSGVKTIDNRIKDLEESFKESIKNQTDVLSRNHDRVISKTENGDKRIVEVLDRLLERMCEKDFGVLNDTRNGANQEYNISESTPATLPCSGVNTGISTLTDGGKLHDNLERIEPAWSTVVAGGTIKKDEKASYREKENNTRDVPQINKSWRQRLNVLHGTAFNNEGCTLAANVELVAYGLGKDVTSIQLSNFLQDKGIDIIDCQLLTKFEGARSLSFKITVKPQHFEKVKDPSLWPYRVGMRLYKHFNSGNKMNNITGTKNIRNQNKSLRFASRPLISLV